MRELYRARRDIFLDEAERRLSDHLQPQQAAGGLQVACLLTDERTSDRKLTAQAEAAGIDLPVLSKLYFGEQKANGFVMGYSALPPAAIRDGVKKLAALWKA
jgi:GntR family transcriptional regulator/MocR family aminotransferase